MLRFAESNFVLDKFEEDGHSLRIHLMSAWRQFGVKPKQLDIKLPPQSILYLWDTYWKLRNRQALGMNGHNPIGWLEIKAFMEVTNTKLENWEIEVLTNLDNSFLSNQ